MIRLDHEVLQNVLKPSRYTGGEWNAVKKDWDTVDCTFALSLPDVYEVGMSNLGLAILYDALNRQENVAAEGETLRERLIKSKERVQKHGEVFTPNWMVKLMLSNPPIKAKLADVHATFFEPSAGVGAFLMEILRQKVRRPLAEELAAFSGNASGSGEAEES